MSDTSWDASFLENVFTCSFLKMNFDITFTRYMNTNILPSRLSNVRTQRTPTLHLYSCLCAGVQQKLGKTNCKPTRKWKVKINILARNEHSNKSSLRRSRHVVRKVGRWHVGLLLSCRSNRLALLFNIFLTLPIPTSWHAAGNFNQWQGKSRWKGNVELN